MRRFFSTPLPTIAAFTLLLLPFAFVAGCNVDQTREAKAPDVDVDVDPGQWPKYDVKWADVDVGSTTKTVTVPKLQLIQEEETVEVPYIDINAPGAGDREDRTVSVELEVPNGAFDVDIKEIRAAGDTLWVIAQLNATDRKTDGSINRVSDQVIIRAPEDLEVRKVIIGERPDGTYNQQFTFYGSREALDQKIPAGSRVIYSS
ncbi:MAG: hypothetical protein U5J83_13085 [Bryobacterales bacterium]|nr:hypothetical protein [Bryobacterales bacterium]